MPGDGSLRLSPFEQAFLEGARGPGAAKAMEILAALARVADAHSLVPVQSAHVSGVSYRNIGDAGVHFLRSIARGVSGLAVPATINPGGVDLESWRELGADPAFASKQKEIVDLLAGMGFDPILSCAPYHCGNVPARGEVVAWAESSAVAYANSVLGARTQREGGPSALAAAITGRTVPAGTILDSGRKPTLLVDVSAPLRDPSDCGALGILAGRAAGQGIPYFRGAALPRGREEESLRALGAAMAAAGAVALFHWEGVTPEAVDGLEPDEGLPVLRVKDLGEGYRIPGTKTAGPVDLVALGCPHASVEEIREIAAALQGKDLRAKLWVMTSRRAAAEAEARGWGEAIRRAGGRIVRDTCIVVAPLRELGIESAATDSAKAATYLPSHQKVRTFFGNRDACLAAAVRGEFRGSGS
jgi:predicted aconitase